MIVCSLGGLACQVNGEVVGVTTENTGNIIKTVIVRLVAVGLLLTIFTLGSHLLLSEVTKGNDQNSANINVSGKQRMLSQRIVLLAKSIGPLQTAAENEEARADLIEMVEQMETANQFLTANLKDTKPRHEQWFSSGGTADIKALFFGPELTVDADVKRYLITARKVLEKKDSELSFTSNILQDLYVQSRILLPRLDRVVSAYEAESRRRVQILVKLQTVITLLFFIVLIGSAAVVFYPMVRRIQKDLNVRSQANELISQSERRFRNILNSALDAIITIDRNGRVTGINSSAKSIFGYGQEAIGQDIASLIIPAEYRDAHHRGMERYHQTGEGHIIGKQIETRAMRADGTELDIELTVVGHEESGEPLYTAFIRDISERKKQEEEILYQAHYDQLTGLPNRVMAIAKLDEAIGENCEGDKLVALLVELDAFKEVNDSLGHEFGDQLLQAVAERLKDVTRDEDILARLGGDEFLIIAPKLVSTAMAEVMASKIQKAFSHSYMIDNRDVVVTASIGLSVYPDDGTTAQLLLRNADAAVYMAKDSGRNTYKFFTPKLTDAAMGRLQIEQQLHKALEKNELSMVYQPLVEAGSNRIIAMEALVRWNNEELGFVSPMDFIPIAETTGLILPIGRWILEQACQQAKRIMLMGVDPFRVCVNISPRQLIGFGIIGQIEDVLKETGLPARYLEIEVTEGVLIHDQNESKLILDQLKDLGVHLSIDDFGTGYSSLAYLKRYPFDSLKIDRSFIMEIADSPEDKVLVRTIITMANGFGFQTIAEGVEDKEHVDLLSRMGCDVLQGYHFSRPVPIDDFIPLLQDMNDLPSNIHHLNKN